MAEPVTWRARLRRAYERHALRWHLAFFAGGFLLDVLSAREGVDHPFNILTQVAYLAGIGAVLAIDLIRESQPEALRFGPRLERLWAFRRLAVHFGLGGLMNMYSIFFLMSASWFSSALFVVLLFALVVANEVTAVQESGLDVKVGLYVLCLFCFWSLMIPLALGQVGRLTFVLSFVATLAVLAAMVAGLRRRLGGRELRRRLVVPGLSVAGCFLLFYLVGMIPPVPIAAKHLGVYHLVERRGDAFVASHERPWWRFWHAADERFVARPGDRVFVFVAVYSPARFDDTVFVRWRRLAADGQWAESDRIPIHIVGGREGGFRGYTSKQNYSDGRWRVDVETRDGREIAREYFTITSAAADPARVLKTTVF